jgi:hypothetical protein
MFCNGIQERGMDHISAEELIDYVDGHISDAARNPIELHLAECGECAELKLEIQSLVLQLQADASHEPPAELVQWGNRLFQPLAQPSTGARLRKLVAALVFDTLDQPMLAGVRHAGTAARQLLYRAGDVDVDVKIESMESNERITLVGQVLATSTKFLENTPVKLESHGMTRFKTTTNLVGEFSFDEVPKDTYHLSVDLPEGQITLFCVHRGNS